MAQRGQRGAIPSPPGGRDRRGETAELPLGGVARRGSRGVCRPYVRAETERKQQPPVLAREPSTETMAREEGRKESGGFEGKKGKGIEGWTTGSFARREEEEGFDTPGSPNGGRREVEPTRRVWNRKQDGAREREEEEEEGKGTTNGRAEDARGSVRTRFYVEP